MKGRLRAALFFGPTSGGRSIFTQLLRKKNADLEWLGPWLELDNLADLMELPHEWVVCPMCAEYFWRFPPHGFEPCPFAKSMAESAGLKMDAERMTAVRAGVHFENMSNAMRAFMEESGLREEEDDDE